MMLKNKVTIIGAGMVGSTTAFSLIAADTVEEIVLVDINQKLALAQAMDLQHSVPFYGSAVVRFGDYDDLRDSKVVIICCGAAQKPGETRLELVKKNSTIIKEIMPIIFRKNPKIIVVMVTNPVDILTYLAIKMFPVKKRQILGSGTILDSARFRQLLSQKFKISPHSIHAYIVGEHGDSELPLWSTATIGSTSVDNFYPLSAKEKKQIFEKAKNAAYAIIAGKQATYYAIGAGAAALVGCILHNRNLVLPVSHLIEGEFGIKNVCLSLPAVVGSSGVGRALQLDLDAKEKTALRHSAKVLKQVIKKIIK